MEILIGILRGAFDAFLFSAPFVLLGLVAAGLLHVFVPRRAVDRFLGGRGLFSALRAALFGVPLPICSCGVLPLALSLERKGASKPASLAFLITTPESGADSIALTWGMLGPFAALFRPFASLFTAMLTAVFAIAARLGFEPLPARAGAASAEPPAETCPRPECCADEARAEQGEQAAGEGTLHPHEGHAHEHDAPGAEDDAVSVAALSRAAGRALRRRLGWGPLRLGPRAEGEGRDAAPLPAETRAFSDADRESERHAERDVDRDADRDLLEGTFSRASRFAFVTLLDDIAFWLVLGFFAAGAITALVPADLAERGLGGGLFAMLVMIVAAVPIYVCASASTPIAAALIAKGLSPGAAMVFLLAGPGVNAASLVVLGKHFGGRFLRVYLSGIIAGSLAAGFAFDALLAWTGIELAVRLAPDAEGVVAGALTWGSALALGALLAWRLHAGAGRAGLADLATNLRALTGPLQRRLPDAPRARRRVAIGLALFALALGWFSAGLETVPPGRVGFATIFGRVVGEARPPGLHFVPAWPVGELVVRHADYARKSDVGFRTDLSLVPLRRELRLAADPRTWHSPVSAMNTKPLEASYVAGDENLVQLSLSVYWRLADPQAFFYGLDKSHDIVALYAQAEARRFIGARSLDELLTETRAGLEDAVARSLSARLAALGSGIEVTRVHVVDVHPPQDAVYAFRDVSSAKEERETRIHRAHERGAALVPRARGEASRVVVAAEAERDARARRAEGRAEAFEAQAEAIREERALLRDLLWLEMLERVLPGRDKVIVPPGAGAGEGAGVTLWKGAPPLPPGESGGSDARREEAP